MYQKDFTFIPFGGTILSLTLCLALAHSEELAASASSSPEEKTKETEMKKAPVVPNQYLVSFKKELSEKECLEILKAHGLKALEKVGSSLLFLVEIKDDKKLEELKAHSQVRYVEANMVMKTF